MNCDYIVTFFYTEHSICRSAQMMIAGKRYTIYSNKPFSSHSMLVLRVDLNDVRAHLYELAERQKNMILGYHFEMKCEILDSDLYVRRIYRVDQ